MKILVHEHVTGGGLAGSAPPPSWLTEGRAMRRAVAADFEGLGAVEVVVTVDSRFEKDGPEPTTVAVGPGQEKDVVARLARACDLTVLIAPETEGVLERLSRLVEAEGGTSLGSTPEAVALTADKLRLAEHFRASGVRSPRTVELKASNGSPSDFPYPAVVKPVDGAGALQTYFCEGPETPAIARAIIQPYCAGLAYSASYLVGPSGAIRIIGVGLQDIQKEHGALTYHGGRMPAPTEFARGEPLKAVRSVAGLRGFVGVDFVRDETSGEIWVIEINPRPTTSYVGLAHLLPPGMIARAWLDLFQAPHQADDLRGMIADGSGHEIVFSPEGSIRESGARRS